MRTIRAVKSVVGMVALLFAASSMAAVIEPGVNPDPTPCDFEDPGQNCWEIDPDGNADMPSLEELADIVGVDVEDIEILFKQDVGGGESGSFGDNYTATFDNEPNDPSEATITWDGGDFIDCGICFLWIKDGKQNPYLYIFDISSWWDGMDTLNLREFWPNQGAISNTGIFGGGGGDMELPEPGTLGLLGLAAIGLGLVRRRRNR